MRHLGLAGLFGRVRRSRRRRLDLDVIDASFHVDTEAICPDCLQWINPWDYVRRNAFDLLEHEVCPPVVVRHSRG